MDRLTTVKGLRRFHILDVLGYNNCRDYCSNHEHCMDCEIRLAFERLAAYEDTELTPEEITAMKADNKRLHDLLSYIDSDII